MKYLRTALWVTAALCPGTAAAESTGLTPRLDTVPPPAKSAASKPDPNLVALDKRVFFGPHLLEPQGALCAACHDLGRALAPMLKGEALRVGVPAGSRPERMAARNAPSLLYLRYIPHHYFSQDDDASFPSPLDGFFTGGRADSIPEQIRGPLFNPDKMGNQSTRNLQRKVAGTDLGKAFAKQFGANMVREPERLVNMLGKALEVYFQSDELAPLTSRFDDFLRKRTPFSAAEMHGLALFRNPDKGNYASFHLIVESSSRPERSLFANLGYNAIAVPRDPSLPVNKDARHFDISLCQTAQTLKWPEPDQWYGYSRTAGPRNVAVRQTFTHSGMFRTLRDTTSFYVTRSTDPMQWYPDSKRFNDVPAKYQDNINVNAVPTDHRPGTTPTLTEDEIDDAVTFLRTLTDARYVALMPNPIADKARSAYAPKVTAKTVALERQPPTDTNMR